MKNYSRYILGLLFFCWVLLPQKAVANAAQPGIWNAGGKAVSYTHLDVYKRQMLTSVDMIPDLNLGVVVLTNTENSGGYAFRAINRTILDSYLKLEDNNWIEKYSKRYQANKSAGDTETTKVWKTVEANKKIKINTSDYIGIYEDKWFGKMEVFMKGNQSVSYTHLDVYKRQNTYINMIKKHDSSYLQCVPTIKLK